ncbi:MAG: hypothetical protein OEZ58_06260 [Gammaproteobacteria bacterium]|nr:hypothetical protein [Gammaproteobacteria bacterium]MDH5728573.1 hypothetical protein [Gammaproteobacteria bacterium]
MKWLRHGIATLIIVCCSPAAYTDNNSVVSSNEPPTIATTIPFKQTDPVITTGYIVKVAFVLIILLALAYAGLYFLRSRLMPAITPDKKNKIKILDSTRITTRTTLITISTGRNEYLLAQSGDTVVVIDKQDTNSRE